MGRTRTAIVASLPKARQESIAARAADLHGEMEGLKIVRSPAPPSPRPGE